MQAITSAARLASRMLPRVGRTAGLRGLATEALETVRGTAVQLWQQRLTPASLCPCV